ncbi:DnaD domain-containing protein [Peribacillus glennii]|uniref:DnaD domain protein n=1 Tax=Peribacillus glennii TaxID=2303991 RepID=A0A372LGS4_9BACI|nr:DnaD domain-containing protein [Peribacillus glennii]RFU65508.1 DnaD domain protein [Peribacillus glennii]
MIKDKLFAWFKEGTITIPSFLFSHYKAMGLNEEEVMLLLQLHNFRENGNEFPTPGQIAERMTFGEQQCLGMVQRMVQKGFIEIKEEYPGSILHESYSIEPMFEKMIECFLKTQNEAEIVKNAADNESLYTIFEKEFGRPLSPFECETLAMWMEEDHHADIIKAALRESVLSGKVNFRYIDRILFEWKRNGIKTMEQAKQHSEKFRIHQKRAKRVKPAAASNEIPFYNWLEQ